MLIRYMPNVSSHFCSINVVRFSFTEKYNKTSHRCDIYSNKDIPHIKDLFNEAKK